jgi:hypothetical protein
VKHGELEMQPDILAILLVAARYYLKFRAIALHAWRALACGFHLLLRRVRQIPFQDLVNVGLFAFHHQSPLAMISCVNHRENEKRRFLFGKWVKFGK